MTDTHRPSDDDARALADALLRGATHGALGTLDGGAPMVTRAGVLWLTGQGVGMLLSDLSDHARALRIDPAASLLVGEAGPRGDPLTHPRLTLVGRAVLLDKAFWRDRWLAARPKAALYYDFADFHLWCLRPDRALLNAGFGRAYRLAPADLGLP
ncbi:pyridoxamine 5'-phosphate oxidase family protein [Jannaschia rubra]|uniref:Pyridoxamine 5'-phosphate oxidase N-terminal domain-containing protein n=1 Tax=Jannaschia rubra TaxID=282197 RepID=A0A0M6XRP9_9RHOB|nr:hypothetical protein [Jannaschia rubra]CTQ33392.1 hypothetical protein JAN5088_02174 [Jannaschia rubra]SFG00684.1 hypothetical protein SAMN04488517_102220 [Jannaschia rubra]